MKNRRSLTKLEKYGLIALAAAIGFYFYVNKVYNPMKTKLEAMVKKEENIAKSFSAVQWEFGDEQEFNRKLNVDKDCLDEIKPQYQQYCQTICPDEEIHQFLNLIHAHLKQNELNVREFVPLENLKDDVLNIPRFGYEVELAGGYLDFVAFLEQLTTLPYVVVVRNVHIESTEDRNNLIINCMINI